MINALKSLFSNNQNESLTEILAQKPFLVDVRTKEEFECGHVKGSINIPLGTIIANLNKFKNKNHIIVFCKSGGRSSMAKDILHANGISNVTNGETWVKIKGLI